MVVVAMIVMAVIVVRRRRMSVGSMGIAMRVVVVIDGVAARAARVRAGQSDNACEDGAQQRQEDNCLNHDCA